MTSDEEELLRRIRKRVDLWPALKQRAAAAGLFTNPGEEGVNMDSENWTLEEEVKKYWHAYGERWEARVEHDGEDSWVWWVWVGDGEYVAEGSLSGPQLEDGEDPHTNEGLLRAKSFVHAVINQAASWMMV
ncbi:MAG: hypothetical protein E4H01_09530 [Lysobacterales bacterium]|nr:MAG: hypothetical protein E4H01_09530 [Xanthomonadales bacterium]